MTERLTERHGKYINVQPKEEIRCSNYCSYCGKADCDHIRTALEKLARYEDLEEQGRLIELPCAVGDTVWFYSEALEEVCKGQVIGFGLNFYTTPQLWIEVEYTSSLIGNQTYKSRVDLMIGKKVFLTPEEAEAALKGNSNEETDR